MIPAKAAADSQIDPARHVVQLEAAGVSGSASSWNIAALVLRNARVHAPEALEPIYWLSRACTQRSRGRNRL